MPNVNREDQCWFDRCRYAAKYVIVFRGSDILVCGRHYKQFAKSHEKH
jgi:hypothetical protein